MQTFPRFALLAALLLPAPMALGYSGSGDMEGAVEGVGDFLWEGAGTLSFAGLPSSVAADDKGAGDLFWEGPASLALQGLPYSGAGDMEDVVEGVGDFFWEGRGRMRLSLERRKDGSYRLRGRVGRFSATTWAADGRERTWSFTGEVVLRVTDIERVDGRTVVSWDLGRMSYSGAGDMEGAVEGVGDF